MENEKNGVKDVFLESLYTITEDDIKGAFGVKPSKGIPSMLIRILVIIVCICVFIYSMSLLVERISDYGKNDELYSMIADIWYNQENFGSNPFGSVAYSIKNYSTGLTLDYRSSQNADETDSVSDTEDTGVVISEDSELLIYIKSKMNALRKQNSDVVGWITIDDTIIDYPVVYSGDNEYYLNHAFDDSYSIGGTPFIDFRDEPNFDDNYNTVIYGHNLMSGQMFSDLDKFFTKSFFNSNRYIYIYNDNGMYVYETFCVTKISVTINYTRVFFSQPSDFVEFAYAMKKRSAYPTDTVFTGKDKIITLSTCTNAHNSAERYCIMAKLVEIRR